MRGGRIRWAVVRGLDEKRSGWGSEEYEAKRGQAAVGMELRLKTEVFGELGRIREGVRSAMKVARL